MSNHIGDANKMVGAAQEAVRKPDGYHYRYPTLYGTGTYIRHNNGEEVNGSKPIEAVPYYYAPVAAAPDSELHALLANSTPLREAAFRALGFIDRESSGGEESYRHLQKALHDECASTPAAPGIDLDDVRALLRYGCAGEACTDEEIQNQRHYDAAAERLYSILIDGKIDASPKGDVCSKCRGTGEVCTGTVDGVPELFDCDKCSAMQANSAEVGA
jgi:hypothetical protein